MQHAEIIKLVVAYTLLGAFIFTVVVTCLSMIKWNWPTPNGKAIIEFVHSNQQKKLFVVLVVELCIAGVAYFAQLITFNARGVANSIAADERNTVTRQFVSRDPELPTYGIEALFHAGVHLGVAQERFANFYNATNPQATVYTPERNLSESKAHLIKAAEYAKATTIAPDVAVQIDKAIAKLNENPRSDDKVVGDVVTAASNNLKKRGL